MKKILFFQLVVLTMASSCIGDDFVNDTVDPVLRISTSLDSLELGTSIQFEHNFFNNVGIEESVDAVWSSSDDDIIAVSRTGLAEAIAPGSAYVQALLVTTEAELRDSLLIHVGNNTVVSEMSIEGSIRTTSSYELTGDFTLRSDGQDLSLEFENNYKASSALPGLFIYLSNNPNSISGALEISRVDVFSGTHTYDISNVGINEYSHILYFCKPFNVKVGDGAL